MKKIFFVFALVLVLSLVVSCSQQPSPSLQEKYDSLESEYDAACSRIENMRDAISSLEDDIATLYCYFGDEETFSNANSAFTHLKSVLESIK